MTDRVEIKGEDAGSDSFRQQSDMFEDSFIKNLKGLQAKIKQHVKKANEQSPDLEYIGEATRKLVELKILELDSLIEARRKEQEWVRKREIRSAQSARLEQARLNVSTLLGLHQSGSPGLENDIESCIRIMREVENIGADEILKEKAPTAEKILESFHVTETDLKRAFNKTNVGDIMRQAKKNGWTMTISEDEVALYRNGNRIDGTLNDFTIDSEQTKDTNKKEKNLKKLLARGGLKKYNAVKTNGLIKRK